MMEDEQGARRRAASATSAWRRRPRDLRRLPAWASGLLLAAGSAAAKPATAIHTIAPRPSVQLSLAEATPVIGVTGETELRIEVLDPPVSPMPMPRVLCSAGQIEDLGRGGPTSFTARFILPSSRFPQPAILVAEFGPSPAPLRGMLPVPLRAAATPSLRTDPGAQVTLRVGEHEFGPQTAPADGVVHIPVVVPPGVESATARSTNRYGKAREQTLDLRVPYSQRLLLVPPESMAAGAAAEVAVYAVETSGIPADASAIRMRAQGAKVQPLGSRAPGEARFLVSAPTILRQRTLRLEAQLEDQSTTRVATLVALVPGRAASLSIEPEAPYLTPDGKTELRAFLSAEDAFGNPVDPSRADVVVDGAVSDVKPGSGEPVVILTPAPGNARREVVVEGVLDDSHTIRRIPVGLPPPPPPTCSGPRRAPRYTVTTRLGVLWNLGRGSGATLFVDGTAYRSARYPNLGLGLSLGLAETWFDAEGGNGITRTSLTALPVLFEIRRRASAKQFFFALGAAGGFATAFGRMQSYGATVTGTGYGAALQATVESGFVLGEGHVAFSLRYLAIFLSDLSSGDRITGNAAGAVADVGYRLIW